MQIQDVVQRWCDVRNAATAARERAVIFEVIKTAVIVVVLVALAYFGIEHMDFSSSTDPSGDRGAMDGIAGMIGFMTIMMRGFLISQSMPEGCFDQIYWSTLNDNWQISDDLIGQLAAAEAVPVDSKAAIARRLCEGKKVTIGFLRELEGELAREDQLEGEGHRSILRYAERAR